MPQLIEIEGGLARVINREVIHSVALRDVMPHIENRPPITLPLLPDNTKIVHWDATNLANQKLCVAIQLDPKVRTITDHQTRAIGGPLPERQYRISLPYTLFIFDITTPDPDSITWNFHEYRVFHSREPITSLDQEVIPAFLPNVYSDGRICFGNTGTATGRPMADRVNEIVNGYYLSSFDSSHHVRENYLPWRSPDGDFTTWVEKTEADPSCWRTFPEWDDLNRMLYRRTVKDLFRETLTRDAPIQVTGTIPEMPVAPTFGRAEEWLLTLASQDRARLRVALTNIEADEADEAPF